jgi:hypothetical protein
LYINTEQHSVLNGLVEHGYSGIGKISKLCILLKGVTTTTAQILTSTALKTSFARSKGLCKDFIKECKSESPMNVSEVQTKFRGNGGKVGSLNPKRKAPGGDPEDNFYSRAAYNVLSDEQTDTLHQKNLNRGNVPTKKIGKEDREQYTAYRIQIYALTSRLGVLETAEPKDYNTEAKGSRSNKALTWQKK